MVSVGLSLFCYMMMLTTILALIHNARIVENANSDAPLEPKALSPNYSTKLGIGVAIAIGALIIQYTVAVKDTNALLDALTANDNVPIEELDDNTNLFNLGGFTVNVKDGRATRVLRIKIELELKEGGGEIITKQKTQLRDAVIQLVSNYSHSDLKGLEGRLRLQDELIKTLNKSTGGKPTIERLYFSEFILE